MYVPTILEAQHAPAEDLVWPLPPEQPRIRYIGFYHSEQDVGKGSSFGAKIKRAVLGKSEDLISFKRPHDVYVDESGRLYATDLIQRKVVVLDPGEKEGRLLGLADGPGVLASPMGLDGDGRGNVYVTDPGFRRVVVFDSTGKFVNTMGGDALLMNPVDVAVDAERGRVYVIDSQLHQVVVFNVSGDLLTRIGRDEGEIRSSVDTSRNARGGTDVLENRGSAPGEFRFPSFATLDKNGRLYVTDQMNFRVQVFDAEGNFLSEFGKAGNVPGTFARPKGIALDSEGHIYVADAAFNNVQIFDAEGQILLAFGGMGFGEGELRLPTGIYLDGHDRIYVVDKLNSRIQAYEYLPEPVTNQ